MYVKFLELWLAQKQTPQGLVMINIIIHTNEGDVNKK